MTGTGIKTAGIGQKTTAHLNLTRSLADVIEFEGRIRAARLAREESRRASARRAARRAFDKRIPYAGKELAE